MIKFPYDKEREYLLFKKLAHLGAAIPALSAKKILCLDLILGT